MDQRIIGPNDLILITGATGFIGRKLLEVLIALGFKNIRCLVRPSSDRSQLTNLAAGKSSVELFTGNLLLRRDCEAATKDVSVIYHLAAGTGTKSYADAFLNSVVTTRNLLDATVRHGCLRRFVSISSFAVYAPNGSKRVSIVDEDTPVESAPELRGDAYCFAKCRQDALVMAYGRDHGTPYVLLRPGAVYGPGKERIPGRVGINTFGFFLHLGGANPIPLTFVDNCAEAIALAGITAGIDGEVFNIVDDDLPSSRRFLERYKREVRRFPSIYVPHSVSYALCFLWEKYADWSHGQLPPVFNRKAWTSFWKQADYRNSKIKQKLGWSPRVTTSEGLAQYFESCRNKKADA